MQMSKGGNLNQPIQQSDGAFLSLFQQAVELPVDMHPRWIVTCDFQEFQIYDMNQPQKPAEILKLSDLPREYCRLNFLVDPKHDRIQQELDISIAAGELVGELYDALQEQYPNPTDPETLHHLNVLCVRIVFCLYAEKSGIFPKRSQFHDFLEAVPAEYMSTVLGILFLVLDQDFSTRSPVLAKVLSDFPYVGGDLFSDHTIQIPDFTPKIRDLLLKQMSESFDWSQISPPIFGAVFESTLNPETRHSGGMHYTHRTNIHKALDPLIFTALKNELAAIRARPLSDPHRKRLLRGFGTRLASLTFLDPACGSGNFLTEAYMCIRSLENGVIRELMTDIEGQVAMSEVIDDRALGIQVSIEQFYGIEINDFAVSVARTALWIAEHQMMLETSRIIHRDLDFLPLKTSAHIYKGNALLEPWETIVPKDKLRFIIGNPPWLGYSLQSKEQKNELRKLLTGPDGKPWHGAGKLDYVSGWYYKAAQMMQGTEIQTVLVSTNSLTQGEQVSLLWKPLVQQFGVHINFAHRTFRWDSEAANKAHVHCVVIGFSTGTEPREKLLYTGEIPQKVTHINSYLLDTPDVFVESRAAPLCKVPPMVYGNKPTDGQFLFLTAEVRSDILAREPALAPYIRRAYGAEEFINNKERFCLWLKDAPPKLLNRSPFLKERLDQVQKFRQESPKLATQLSAMTPSLFQEIRQPESEYILVPRHSSEQRLYIPLGFVSPEIIATDAVQIIPNADLLHFGVLTSSAHMAWMRLVCGRLEMRYRYSAYLVYNTFPWPKLNSKLTDAIRKSAQAILDARARHPGTSLADLYSRRSMPSDLLTAHQANDRAVLAAYGLPSNASETDIITYLLRRYKQLKNKSNTTPSSSP